MISMVTRRLTEVGQAAPVRAHRAAMDKMVDSIRSTLKAKIWMTCLEICSAACSTANPDRSSPARAIGRILEVDSAELMVTARASAARIRRRFSARQGFGGTAGSGYSGGFGSSTGNGYTGGFDGFDFGGGSYGGFGSSQRGEDLRAEISVSFDEAAFGCEKKISLQGQDGKISTVQVKIPAGIESGKTIRLRGKGMPGSNLAGDGDLLLKVDVQEKPGFERKGADLYTTVKIPFTTAVLGGEAEVATLTGKVVCRIKPGTQSGSRIRLKGKGIVSMNDASVHGDQYVTVQIDVPKNLSAAAKQKLREFEEACKGGSSRGAA